MLAKLLALILALFVVKFPVTPGVVNLSPTPEATPSPTPTPKPLTFTQMNALYGPCVYLPTLMYHHVQSAEKAKESKQTGLTVNTDKFRLQMQYLKTNGFTTVQPANLIAFFDQGVPLPKKSVLITFDDGYKDFYSDALPILKEMGFTATMFLPTGLTNNFGYLNWSEIADAASSGIYFANHTWSHKNAKAAPDIEEQEITTADTQLTERSLNIDKVFAYPYGFSSSFAESVLSKLNYKLAFTTAYGSTQCKQQRFDLPRIRVGNINKFDF